MPRSTLLLLALLLAGCPTDDDDSGGPADDDDATAADDDDATDDDDAADDDDDATGDDDDAAKIDYLDATVPDFAGCSGNQVKFVLGDGTELGPYDGFQSKASFANCFPQFTIRIGEGDTWAALNGNYEGMNGGVEIPFQSPSSTAGNVVLQASIPESVLSAEAPLDLAGNFGLVNTNRHSDVGGSVTFDGDVPGPSVAVSGTYSGVIQKVVSFSEQVVLLGVAGCFDATLLPTDC